MNDRYRLSKLIRGTLICVYLALVLPLPLMAPHPLQLWLWVAAPLGLFFVVALLSEEVSVDDNGLVVGYPFWCRWLLRRGWQLRWDQICRVVPVGTSQGGTVYYLKTLGEGHRLLQYLRDLRRDERGTDPRRPPSGSDQPLRPDEAPHGAHDVRLQSRLRHALRGPALLQRRRRFAGR